MLIKIDSRELGTILAALRLYQNALEINGDSPPRVVAGIATDDGKHEPLVHDEIDKLCERINGEDRASEIRGRAGNIKQHLAAVLEALG